MTRREILKNIAVSGGVFFLPLCKSAQTAQDNIIKDNKIKGFAKDIVID